jgi:putative heme-binding domain-containing protein
MVRLYLASALQRIPAEQRWPMAEALAGNGDYASDQNHALLIWYGLEPLVARERGRAIALLGRCPSLTICRFLARRLVAADADAGLAALLPALQGRPESYPSFHGEVLDGVLAGLLGRKRVPMPPRWPAVFAGLSQRGDSDVRAQAAALGLVFGDPQAEASLRSLVADRADSLASRRFALQCLVDRRGDGLAPLLLTLLDDPDLRAPAIRALAASHDPATPGSILRRYPALSAAERDDAIATLAARPAWALALLEAIAQGKVPRRDLNTTVARQILAFRAPNLSAALERTLGTLRPTAGDKTRLIAKYKGMLAAADLPPADPDRGRALFGRICAQCHRLFGQGGEVGPDLTGSDRANPDYILENVLDPNASVGRDYTLTTVATRDGRLISGILREQTPEALVIQTAAERITVSREDVEEVKGSNVSMMPEGQLEALTPQEVRDLFAYLAAPQVAPSPNAKPAPDVTRRRP